MTDYLVKGLVKRGAAVVREMKTAQALLTSLAKDLETPDAAIKLVANVDT